jgi:hypothetical protein
MRWLVLSGRRKWRSLNRAGASAALRRRHNRQPPNAAVSINSVASIGDDCYQRMMMGSGDPAVRGERRDQQVIANSQSALRRRSPAGSRFLG